LLGRLLNRGAHRPTKAEPIDVEGTRSAIETLSRENRDQPDMAREGEILRLRERAGAGLKQDASQRPDVIEPDNDALAASTGIPELSAAELSPGVIRAAILRDGAVIVRGLFDPEPAAALTAEIDRAIESSKNGKGHGFFEPLPVEELQGNRAVTMSTGTLLLADCPRVAFQLLSLYESAGLEGIIGGYLNERPALSADKTTLRKAGPSEPGGWHQDGKFLGDVNSLNLWVSLSHCGDTAPGLDLVPRRLSEIVEAGVGPGGLDAITVPHERAEELAGELGVARPIFEPGDAIFFDHMNLHRTAADPAMTGTRYAVESWFFGPSAFPDGYTSLAF
jgi:hypothetical protein